MGGGGSIQIKHEFFRIATSYNALIQNPKKKILFSILFIISIHLFLNKYPYTIAAEKILSQNNPIPWLYKLDLFDALVGAMLYPCWRPPNSDSGTATGGTVPQ